MVNLKNLPLSYLKERSPSFFTSDKFEKAVGLFNTYKKPVTDDSGESADKLILPISLLSDILVAKYFDYEFVPTNAKEESDLAFLQLYALKRSPVKLKPKKVIDSSINAFQLNVKYLASFIPPSIWEVQSKAVRSALDTIDAPNSKLVRPTSTNILANIAGESNFYNRMVDSAVFDYTDFSKSAIESSRLFQAVNLGSSVRSVRRFFKDDTEYKTSLKEVYRHIEKLKEKAIGRYFSYPGSRYGSELDDIRVTLDTSLNEAMYSRIAEFKLSGCGCNSSFRGYTHNAIESNTKIVSIKSSINASKPFLVKAFDKEGMERKDFTFSTVASYEIVVSFDDFFKGAIILLQDINRAEDLINLNLKDYIFKKDYNEYIELFDVELNEDNVVLPKAGMKDNPFFIEVIDDDGTSLPLTALRVDNDSIRFKLPTAVKSFYTVCLLPMNLLAAGSNNIPLNNVTVLDFISTINIFEKDIELYIVKE